MGKIERAIGLISPPMASYFSCVSTISRDSGPVSYIQVDVLGFIKLQVTLQCQMAIRYVFLMCRMFPEDYLGILSCLV